MLSPIHVHALLFIVKSAVTVQYQRLDSTHTTADMMERQGHQEDLWLVILLIILAAVATVKSN